MYPQVCLNVLLNILSIQKHFSFIALTKQNVTCLGITVLENMDNSIVNEYLMRYSHF